jgi:L-alanine-DL-glutamate epimerase-like enolase superfamily enzyme
MSQTESNLVPIYLLQSTSCIREGETLDLYLIETSLPPDNLETYGRLSAEQPIPIAAGEWVA